MSKRIAVLTRDRQAEALRMSGGLTLLDDSVEVYVLDRKIEDSKVIAKHLDMVQNMLEIPMFTNCKDNSYNYLTNEELANKLLDYDVVIPY
ncbi:MAG: hypothetical protein EVG15_08235 [Candidatus Acididesulfobacter diazotrophicus]|jgi:hypothetical protein|uniref:Uncharacterized protein n=1 Tax=Candidatus Acididesulfobacter diazotrophicus TaxID=2597226 RepID=A0A519BLB7_9DELT|nr:MAG: hypothetical protein EVG15_08235 [Candidatus Acididesulfobacter diazotrophicus]